MSVTDRDRDRGAAVWQGIVHRYWTPETISVLHPTLTEAIARALAEEREKARAPFQRLADEIEAACRGRQDVVSMTMRDDAALIRATLDDTE